jgi:succinyl-CoA synthetase beta subunit
MARLFEYQGKELLKKAKVPIPEGEVATTPQEAIQFAQNPEEAEKVAGKLLGSEIKDLTVERVLVEEKLDIDREFYAGVIIDASREVRAPVIMFSTEGGVDIEEVPEDKIVLRGLRFYDALNLAIKLKVPTQLLPAIAQAILGLYETFKGYNCRTAEINPLVLTKDGKIYAADCRMAIDDSSVFRHPELGIDVAREAYGIGQDSLADRGGGSPGNLLYRTDDPGNQGVGRGGLPWNRRGWRHFGS